jgi:DNA-binding PadR family transcriptional regulator
MIPLELEIHLPLSTTVFHILIALADGGRHGYAILKDIEDRTGGSKRLGSGTFYRTIRQMQHLGFVEEAEERADWHLDDQRRRYYKLTELGRAVGTLEAQRLYDLVELARAKQFLPNVEPSL